MDCFGCTNICQSFHKYLSLGRDEGGNQCVTSFVFYELLGYFALDEEVSRAACILDHCDQGRAKCVLQCGIMSVEYFCINIQTFGDGASEQF